MVSPQDGFAEFIYQTTSDIGSQPLCSPMKAAGGVYGRERSRAACDTPVSASRTGNGDNASKRSDDARQRNDGNLLVEPGRDAAGSAPVEQGNPGRAPGPRGVYWCVCNGLGGVQLRALV